MWRIFNRLFGWHYVLYDFAYGTYVARIKTAPNGKPMVYYCCTGWYMIDGFHKKMAPLTLSDEEFEKFCKEKGDKNV